MNEKWLNINEIAEYLSINADTVYNWISKRGLPAYKIGKLYKSKISLIDDWVMNQQKFKGAYIINGDFSREAWEKKEGNVIKIVKDFLCKADEKTDNRPDIEKLREAIKDLTGEEIKKHLDELVNHAEMRLKELTSE